MDLKLKDKSVVVTGGGSNIGRAIVLGFAVEGAKITIADIDIKQAEKVAELALKKGAAAVKVIRTDVTNLEQVTAMFAEVKESVGAVDVLVNNVGWDMLMYFMKTTPEFWQKVIQMNYVGVINCTRAALDIMIEQKSGAIVSISSDASRQGEPREAVYAGAKAAVNSFMKTIAKEYGRDGIRCNCVCPGVTIPDSTEQVGDNSMWVNVESMMTQAQLDTIAKTLPLRRFGRPDDLASAVAFLSSDAAGYITGQVLSVSGGYSMIG